MQLRSVYRQLWASACGVLGGGSGVGSGKVTLMTGAVRNPLPPSLTSGSLNFRARTGPARRLVIRGDRTRGLSLEPQAFQNHSAACPGAAQAFHRTAQSLDGCAAVLIYEFHDSCPIEVHPHLFATHTQAPTLHAQIACAWGQVP